MTRSSLKEEPALRPFNRGKDGAIAEQTMSIGKIHKQSGLPGCNYVGENGFGDSAGEMR